MQVMVINFQKNQNVENIFFKIEKQNNFAQNVKNIFKLETNQNFSSSK